MKKSLRFTLILLCLAGSISRLIYGIMQQPWKTAPDQLAWEMILEAGSWNWANLLHYPHEGGSIMISLMAMMIGKLVSFHPLSITAFLIDFIVRLLQLQIVNRWLGRKMALTFGYWTILAHPILIPWGTVTFGLHAIAAISPFLLIAILQREHPSLRSFVVDGLLLGLLVSLYYGNIILLPVYFGYWMGRQKSWKAQLSAFGSLTALLALHFLWRQSITEAFRLAGFAQESIRGVNFAVEPPMTTNRIYEFWLEPFSNAIMAGVSAEHQIPYLHFAWTALVLLGLAAVVRRMIKLQANQLTILPIAMIVSFVAFYALGPFYVEGEGIGSYVSYRHLAYILPVLALISLYGLQTLPKSFLWTAVFIGLSGYFSLATYQNSSPKAYAVEAGGWVLGQKWGHDPFELQQIIEQAPYPKDSLIVGVGWGIGTALFTDIGQHNESLEDRIDILEEKIQAMPDSSQPYLWEGVEFAFSDYVIPQLDEAIWDKHLKPLSTDTLAKE